MGERNFNGFKTCMMLGLTRTFLLLLTIALPRLQALRILQIVPGFTNSHVLFNYRLAQTLTEMGHSVRLWTQMEMNMVFVGDLRLPSNVSEYRVPIHFSNSLKTEGLKIFQSMMFNKGTPYDLWWTGQEFKEMRVEACAQMLRVEATALRELRDKHFDLAIAHFHDLCPLAMAEKVGVRRLIWITHGTSIYDFTAIQMGLRLQPSFVPHPLSSCGARMTFADRVRNVAWHASSLDFVNLPENLLDEENQMYRRDFIRYNQADLWELSKRVNVLLVNGERFLDFPRPLSPGIAFMGEVGATRRKEKHILPDNWSTAEKQSMPPELQRVYDRQDADGVVIFSLGTVSNTTNMPRPMTRAFVDAFAQFPMLEFVWKMETHVPEAEDVPNVHMFRWIPQKNLMKHPKTRLLIAHGGYNSFLEASKAGVPIVLMPLFADQFINAQRALRFGTAQVLDKLTVTSADVSAAIRSVLERRQNYQRNAQRLAAMLADKPCSDNANERSLLYSHDRIVGCGDADHAVLKYGLKLAMVDRPFFTLKAAQRLGRMEYYVVDLFLVLMITGASLSLLIAY